MVTRIFYIVAAVVIGLLLTTLVAIGQQLNVQSGTKHLVVVEYNAFENAIKISSKLDFAGVRVTFDDTPGQSVTVLELRQWIVARPTPPKP